jgi:hypothetical protein
MCYTYILYFNIDIWEKKNIMDKLSISPHSYQSNWDICPSDIQPIEFQQRRSLGSVFPSFRLLPSVSTALYHSFMHSFLPHDQRSWSRSKPCASRNAISATSLQTAGNSLPIHHSVWTLHLVSTISLGHWRSILKGNTSYIMKWKSRYSGGCKHRALAFFRRNQRYCITGTNVSVGLAVTWTNIVSACYSLFWTSVTK